MSWMRKFSFLVFLLSFSLPCLCQSKKHQYRKDRYFFGTSFGIEFTQPIIQDRYSILEPSAFEKKYNALFSNPGGAYGLFFSFAFTKRFSVFTQPMFQTQKYSYYTDYHWSDSIMGGEIYKEMLHKQKISVLHLPLMARMDFTTLRFSPFIQTGLSCDVSYFASKIVYSDNYIDGKVDVKSANPSEVAEMTMHLNRFNVSVIGGAGLTYYREQFAISLATNIKYQLRPTINNHLRFDDFTGFGVQYLDVQDDFRLLNWDVFLVLMVPIHKKW